MSTPRHLYQGEVFCWTRQSLWAFHRGVCQYRGPFVQLDQWGKQRQEVGTS